MDDPRNTDPEWIYDENGDVIPAALSVYETAERLGIHPQTVRSMIKRGELRAVRAGRRVLVPVRAIDEYLG